MGSPDDARPAKGETKHFDSRVRVRGKQFLKTTRNRLVISGRPCVLVRDQVRPLRRIRRYLQLCLSLDTAGHRVDHGGTLQAESKYPGKAYEWNNYRLMCGTLNGRKKDFEDVLDPFRSQMACCDRVSILVCEAFGQPRAGRAKQVRATIDRLKLNDEGTCLKARERYVKRYCRGEIDFRFLQSDALSSLPSLIARICQ